MRKRNELDKLPIFDKYKNEHIKNEKIGVYVSFIMVPIIYLIGIICTDNPITLEEHISYILCSIVICTWPFVSSVVRVYKGDFYFMEIYPIDIENNSDFETTRYRVKDIDDVYLNLYDKSVAKKLKLNTYSICFMRNNEILDVVDKDEIEQNNMYR